jgi:hypothetical protein
LNNQLRQKIENAVCSVLAMELGHTMASFDPPVYGPNTVRMARRLIDEGLLDVLADNADEWAERADASVGLNATDIDDLLAVLRGPSDPKERNDAADQS